MKTFNQYKGIDRKKYVELELGIRKPKFIDLTLGILRKKKASLKKVIKESFSVFEYLEEAYPSKKKKVWKKKKFPGPGGSSKPSKPKSTPEDKARHEYLTKHSKKHTGKFTSASEINKLHKTLVKHHKFHDGYDNKTDDYNESKDEDDHIGHYTDNGSRSINKHLASTKGKPTRYKEDIKNTDNFVSKHKAPKSFEVHTGIDHTRAHHLVDAAKKAHENGETHVHVIHHGFTSTSLHHRIAHEFASQHQEYIDHKSNFHHDGKTLHTHQHVMKIKVHKGQPGAYVDHHSSNRGEKEHVLPRGLKLKVHKTPHVISTHHNRWGDHVSGPDHKDFHHTKHIHHWNATIHHE